MILGFTATRGLLTQAQMRWLYGFLDDAVQEGELREIHHGACVGGDEELHIAATERGIPVVVHPPVKTNFLAVQCVTPAPGVRVLEPRPYLNRDRDIVAIADAVLGLPGKGEDEGGGTWYTINYAVRLLKPVVIVHPDGRVEKRISNSYRGI